MSDYDKDNIASERAELKDPRKSLQERFQRNRGQSEVKVGEGQKDGVIPGEHEHSKVDNTDDEDDIVRNRKQVAMYLPSHLRKELAERYDELDAHSKLEGEGGLEKHRDYYEGLIRCALNSPELEAFVRGKGMSNGEELGGPRSTFTDSERR